MSRTWMRLWVWMAAVAAVATAGCRGGARPTAERMEERARESTEMTRSGRHDGVLAVYDGTWDGARGELRLELRGAGTEGRAVQRLILPNHTAMSSGSGGSTTPAPNTVLLHQTAPRSLDGACNAAPFGEPGVPAPFQGVCVNIEAINGYARDLARTYVEFTFLTAGVTPYVVNADDPDFAVYSTRGLWYYDRLAPAGTAGSLDRRARNWYFQTPVPGGSATFSFVATVKGEVLEPTTRVTPSVGGTPCAVATTQPVRTSRDGRYVVFVTTTSACAAGAGSFPQVVRWDRQTGTLAVVSHATGAATTGSNGSNTSPSISDLGDVVAWRSTATNLLGPGGDAYACTDGNGSIADVFVRDLNTDAIYIANIDMATLATPPGAGAERPSMSSDGIFVAFDTTAPLDPADANALADVYARDIFGGLMHLASPHSPARTAGAIAGVVAYGPVVAYQSDDNTLVAGDTGGTDVFVHDVIAGTTTRVSTTSAGAQGNGNATAPALAGGGNAVAFVSTSTNMLGPATTVGRQHVYVREIAAPATLVRADARALVSGTESNSAAIAPQLDYTGRFVAFISAGTNLDPNATTGTVQVFQTDVRTTDPARMRARLISASVTNAPASTSITGVTLGLASFGDYAVFAATNAGNLVGDTVVGTFIYAAPLR